MSPERSEVAAPERRALMLVVAAGNLIFLVVDWRTSGPAALAGRVALTAAFLAAWAALGLPLRARAAELLVTALGVAVAISVAATAWSNGGSASPYFAFLPMVPLVFGILMPAARTAAGLAGATAALAALLRLWFERAGPTAFAFWALIFATTTAFALVGTTASARQRAREARLEADRGAARAALVSQSRERARLDRFALVGRLAAGVAHDLANPLAAARANVASAEERIAACTASADPELAEVLADLRASLDRMRRTVEDLRAFSREDTAALEDFPVAEVIEEALRLVGHRLGGAGVVAEVPPGLPPARADRHRVVQALVWVVADAAGALGESPPAGRTLRVTARGEPTGVAIVVEAHAAAAAGDDDGFRGLALALAREDLEKDGGALETEQVAGGGVRRLLRLRPGAGAGAPGA